jgi:ferredoxin--NADP+ reductase
VLSVRQPHAGTGGPMMKAISEMTRPLGITTYVSLNAIMVDGTGMCGACRVTVGGETKFACFHGPDFDGHKVDFENLMKRQKMFVQQEKLAMASLHV